MGVLIFLAGVLVGAIVTGIAALALIVWCMFGEGVEYEP